MMESAREGVYRIVNCVLYVNSPRHHNSCKTHTNLENPHAILKRARSQREL